MNRLLVAPSILDCDFLNLGVELQKLERGGADWIHLDVMDGVFVPNLSFGTPLLHSIRRGTKLPIDSHLMVTAPEKLLDRFLPESDQVMFHIEATRDPKLCLESIKSARKKAGISLNPDTALETVAPYLPQLDAVLIMSVFPGFGGQKFIPESIKRISQLRDMIRASDAKAQIWVDGGINIENCGSVAQAGADVIVAGSAICRSSDYAATIARLQCLKP